MRVTLVSLLTPLLGRDRRLQDGEGTRSSHGEAERLVQPDGIDVVSRGMQERHLAPLPHAGRDGPHEAGAETLPAVAIVGTYRADLGPTVRMQPFAGHGDQLTAGRADAEIAAHLDGALEI